MNSITGAATDYLVQASSLLKQRLSQAVSELQQNHEKVGQQTDQMLQVALQLQQRQLEAGRVDTFA